MKIVKTQGKILFYHFFLFLSYFYFLLFPRFSAVILVPELFRKLRETPGKKSDQVWSKSVRSCMSYDQKTPYDLILSQFFLFFGIWASDLLNFDLKFGFLVKNCIYRQLGMSRIVI